MQENKLTLFGFGLIGGLLAALLAFFGNPGNMALCIACFIRDTAGALYLHTNATVQYVRPEITGIVLGALAISLFRKEYQSTGGVLPAALTAVLVLALIPSLLAFSSKGPGSMHTPVLLSLICGLVFGAVAQLSRMCFAGSFRNLIFTRDISMIIVICGVFAAMLIYNLTGGSFKLSFAGQPIAHSEHLWSMLGMFCVGLAATLAGGCPLRQLVLAGQGSSDAAMNVLGMFAGAAVAHNFGLASSPSGTTANGQIAVVIILAVLLLIGFLGCRNKEKA